VHERQFRPSKSRIKIYKVESKGLDLPVIYPSCDLCEGEGYPQCVKYCPTVALKLVELTAEKEHVLDRIRLESAKKMAELEKVIELRGGS
jgi:Fe-S-cluster-containing hydrogenase component 2